MLQSWGCDVPCALTVLLTPGFCKTGTGSIEVEGATEFTVGGIGTSILTCVVDAKLTGVLVS